jgi:tRNA U54 and U55 pseudouridine synthase Pus10
VEVKLRSVYVYGRYTKLERGIPQTRWPCRSCKGRGCDRCGGTGRQFPTSVEELIEELGVEIKGPGGVLAVDAATGKAYDLPGEMFGEDEWEEE